MRSFNHFLQYIFIGDGLGLFYLVDQWQFNMPVIVQDIL